jgi:hypothetical protein
MFLKDIIYLIIRSLLPFGGWKMKKKLSFGGHQMMQQKIYKKSYLLRKWVHGGGFLLTCA